MILTIIIAAAIAIIGVMTMSIDAQQQEEYNAAHADEYSLMQTIVVCDCHEGELPTRTMQMYVEITDDEVLNKRLIQSRLVGTGWEMWNAYVKETGVWCATSEV